MDKYSSDKEEFANTSEMVAPIKSTNPPAFSLLKKELNSLVRFNYTNCFKAISKAVALIFLESGFKSCACSIAFLMVSEMS